MSEREAGREREYSDTSQRLLNAFAAAGATLVRAPSAKAAVAVLGATHALFEYIRDLEERAAHPEGGE